MLMKALGLLLTWFVVVSVMGLMGGIGPVELLVALVLAAIFCVGYNRLVRLART